MMQSKLVLSSATALILGAGVLTVSVAPASAQWHHRHGWGPAVVAGGIVGGAIAAATSPLWGPGYYGDGPNYRYGQDYAYVNGPYAYGNGPYDYDNGRPMAEGRSAAIDEPMGSAVAYCEAHFRSYDSSTGTYMGYDGMRHSCP